LRKHEKKKEYANSDKQMVNRYLHGKRLFLPSSLRPY